MGDAAGGEGFCFWEGEHKRGGVGGVGWGAGHDRCTQRLEVTAVARAVEGLPVLSCVEGAG